MLRTTALAALLLASPAWATDDDTQFWLTGTVIAPVGHDLTATVMVSQRFRESARGGDLQLLRAMVDWKLSDMVSIGGGGAYLNVPGGDEQRLHQQVVLSFDRVSLRTQVEERFLPGAPRVQLRVRERLQLSEQVAKRDKLVGSVEWLYIARPEKPTQTARTDNWRFMLAEQHKFTPHLDASVGYVAIYTLRPGGTDRLSHVPQVTLTWRP